LFCTSAQSARRPPGAQRHRTRRRTLSIPTPHHLGYDCRLHRRVDQSFLPHRAARCRAFAADSGRSGFMIFDFEDRRVVFETDNYYIAHNATLVGSIFIGDNVSVWFNAVLRADHDTITIGAETNIQDGAVLHIDAGSPLTMGRGITVGHQAMVHGCNVDDYSLIGIHAVVL